MMRHSGLQNEGTAMGTAAERPHRRACTHGRSGGSALSLFTAAGERRGGAARVGNAHSRRRRPPPASARPRARHQRRSIRPPARAYSVYLSLEGRGWRSAFAPGGDLVLPPLSLPPPLRPAGRPAARSARAARKPSASVGALTPRRAGVPRRARTGGGTAPSIARCALAPSTGRGCARAPPIARAAGGRAGDDETYRNK